MSIVRVDDARVKDIFKKAIVEVLQERRDLVAEILEEAIEDAAMVRAIKAGAKSKSVSRAKILKRLGIPQ